MYKYRGTKILCDVILRGGEVTGEWRKLPNEELNDLYC